MSLSTIIGSLGVALLLVAFLLNLFRYLPQESRVYILLNVVGAGLSCWASFLIPYWPFVILEGVWCGVAIIALVKRRPVASK
jgi:hypothetical protein